MNIWGSKPEKENSWISQHEKGQYLRFWGTLQSHQQQTNKKPSNHSLLSISNLPTKMWYSMALPYFSTFLRPPDHRLSGYSEIYQEPKNPASCQIKSSSKINPQLQISVYNRKSFQIPKSLFFNENPNPKNLELDKFSTIQHLLAKFT